MDTRLATARLPPHPTETQPSSSTVDHLSLDKSDEYYLQTFTFRVERTLFQVPRCRFVNESAIFHGMYSLPQQADAEGLSDDKPIDLAGVEKLDFTRFLRVLYPLHSHGPSGSVDDWTSVLKLSTMWRFKDIRNLAVTQLVPLIGSLQPVMQVSLGYQYGIPIWFLDGLNELVKASRMVAPDEWRRLDWDLSWVFRIYDIREACHAITTHRGIICQTCLHSCLQPLERRRCTCREQHRCHICNTPTLQCGPCTESHIEELKVVFADELQEMVYEESDWVEDE